MAELSRCHMRNGPLYFYTRWGDESGLSDLYIRVELQRALILAFGQRVCSWARLRQKELSEGDRHAESWWPDGNRTSKRCRWHKTEPEARSHLAIEHALLFETQILGGVGHNGERGFGVMPERKERQSIYSVHFIIQRMKNESKERALLCGHVM